MAVSMTQIFDSPTAQVGYHFTVADLSAGLNSLNPVTLVGIQWPTNFVPQGIVISPIFDGTHTVSSKFMYNPATLSNTNIDLYCDATGTTSCQIWVY